MKKTVINIGILENHQYNCGCCASPSLTVQTGLQWSRSSSIIWEDWMLMISISILKTLSISLSLPVFRLNNDAQCRNPTRGIAHTVLKCDAAAQQVCIQFWIMEWTSSFLWSLIGDWQEVWNKKSFSGSVNTDGFLTPLTRITVGRRLQGVPLHFLLHPRPPEYIPPQFGNKYEHNGEAKRELNMEVDEKDENRK